MDISYLFDNDEENNIKLNFEANERHLFDVTF